MNYDLKRLKMIAQSPGVYLMKNSSGAIIYIGKALNLQKRIKQYFSKAAHERHLTFYLMEEVTDIETLLVSNEKEALLLENNLIKKHQPKYNIILKDDKSYVRISINPTDPWPQLKLVRYKDKFSSKSLYFGPYPNFYSAKKLLGVLSELFRLRQCSDAEFHNRSRPCILYEIQKCTAPCMQYCTKEEYKKQVEQTISFLQGNEQNIFTTLQKEKKIAIESWNFERAASLQHQTEQLKNILTTEQVVDLFEATSHDVLGYAEQGEAVSIMVLHIQQGKWVDTHHYIFKEHIENITELLTSFITQYYTSEQNTPNGILLPIPLPDQKMIELWFLEKYKKKVQIEVPNTPPKIQLLELARKNAENILLAHTVPRKRLEEGLLFHIQKKCQLTNYPEKIQCVDISHTSSVAPYGVIITYTKGKWSKAETYFFPIPPQWSQNDYASMKYVITKHLQNSTPKNYPSLLLLDGGKGHFQLGKTLLTELAISNIDLLSISKEGGKHDKGLRGEKVFYTDSAPCLDLAPTDPILFFLQEIRDQAHKTVINYHRKHYKKRSMESILDSIPGIGPQKKNALLRAFPSIEELSLASEEKIAQIPGISSIDAKKICQVLKETKRSF